MLGTIAAALEPADDGIGRTTADIQGLSTVVSVAQCTDGRGNAPRLHLKREPITAASRNADNGSGAERRVAGEGQVPFRG